MMTRRLENGDICFGNGKGDFLTGPSAIAQKIKTKLSLMQGEWFLDLNAGFPWKSMASPHESVRFEAAIKAQILALDGVEALTSFQVQPENGRRIRLMIGLKIAQQNHNLEIQL